MVRVLERPVCVAIMTSEWIFSATDSESETSYLKNAIVTAERGLNIMKKNIIFFISSVSLGISSFVILLHIDEIIPRSFLGDLLVYLSIVSIGIINALFFRDKNVIRKIARIFLSLFLIIIASLVTMFFMFTPMSF